MQRYLSGIIAFHESYMIQNNKSIDQLLLLQGRRIFIGTRPGLCKILITEMTVRYIFLHNQIQAFLSTSFHLFPQTVSTLPAHLQKKMFTDYQQCLLDDGNEVMMMPLSHIYILGMITYYGQKHCTPKHLIEKFLAHEEVERTQGIKYILNFCFVLIED